MRERTGPATPGERTRATPAAAIVSALAGPVALAAMLIGGRPGAWALAAVACGLPVALLALADRRAAGRLARAAFRLALLALLAGSAAAVLWLGGPDGAGESAVRVAGLPPVTWVLLLGIVLVPLVALSVFLAWREGGGEG